MPDLSKIPVLVPEGVEDASMLLPMGALDAACNHLGCDLVDAVRGAVPGKRYAAWAELAYQLARLRGGADKPKRETYREYILEEIQHALGWDREPPPPDPTKSDASQTDSSASPSQEPSDDSPESSTPSP